jgi:hypothetical protein
VHPSIQGGELGTVNTAVGCIISPTGPGSWH